MFSLCEKYGGKRTYPLPVFAEKNCHAIPRGSSCARYVSKATKEMASGLPPVVPSGICRFVRLFSKDGVPLF